MSKKTIVETVYRHGEECQWVTKTITEITEQDNGDNSPTVYNCTINGVDRDDLVSILNNIKGMWNGEE